MTKRIILTYNRLNPSRTCFTNDCDECFNGTCCLPNGDILYSISQEACASYSGVFSYDGSCQPSCSGLLYTRLESFDSEDNYACAPMWFPDTPEGVEAATMWAESDPCAPSAVRYEVTSHVEGWCCESTPYPPLEILPVYVFPSGCSPEPTPTPTPTPYPWY